MTILVDKNGTPYEDKTDIDTVAAKREYGLYYVLVSNDGDLFNPNITGINAHKKDLDRGRKFWNLQKCSRECYDQYTAFLRSKNNTHYLIAQRRYRNDSI